MNDSRTDVSISRRSFLVAAAQIAAGAMLINPLQCMASLAPPELLSFYNTHTGESLKIDYHRTTCSTKTARRLNRFLRDHRTGEIFPIDLRLLDILCKIKQISGSNGTFEVISGYRSPATNSLLRQKSSGVARNSLHLKGQAIDIRLSDLKTKKLKEVAQSLRFGGVGYYSASDFVHLDTGRVRCW